LSRKSRLHGVIYYVEFLTLWECNITGWLDACERLWLHRSWTFANVGRSRREGNKLRSECVQKPLEKIMLFLNDWAVTFHAFKPRTHLLCLNGPMVYESFVSTSEVWKSRRFERLMRRQCKPSLKTCIFEFIVTQNDSCSCKSHKVCNLLFQYSSL
jgi:hypothetical protein